MSLKFIVEPITNGYIVECRGHGGNGDRELVYAADAAAARQVIADATAAWERNITPPAPSPPA